jgi:hypothetical protein
MDIPRNSLIVACSKENFSKLFIGEHAWYPIPISILKIPDIKYIFAYQKSPIAAITHYAEVKEILSTEDKNKYKIVFKSRPIEIDYIEMGKDQRNVPQNPRYGNKDKIIDAKNMDFIY